MTNIDIENAPQYEVQSKSKLYTLKNVSIQKHISAKKHI